MSKSKQLVLKKTHEQLNQFLEQKADALPKDLNETRFLQNCMQVLQDVKGIEKMQPVSVARTMLKGAFLNLDFFMNECYAIPYGNKLRFQTDYTGERKLALMYSQEPIIDIYAKVVRKGEKFESGVKNGRQYLNHEEDGFSNAEIVGAYSVAIYEAGYIRYEKLSTKDIESIRDNFSKQKDGLMWTKRPEEAYKKTVMRLLCKTIEIVFENPEQKQAYDEGSGMEFDNNNEKEKQLSPFDEPVDVEYEEVEDEEDENLSDEELADKVAADMEEDDN